MISLELECSQWNVLSPLRTVVESISFGGAWGDLGPMLSLLASYWWVL